jgi:hypothetical protein
LSGKYPRQPDRLAFTGPPPSITVLEGIAHHGCPELYYHSPSCYKTNTRRFQTLLISVVIERRLSSKPNTEVAFVALLQNRQNCWLNRTCCSCLRLVCPDCVSDGLSFFFFLFAFFLSFSYIIPLPFPLFWFCTLVHTKLHHGAQPTNQLSRAISKWCFGLAAATCAKLHHPAVWLQVLAITCRYGAASPSAASVSPG